MAPRTCGICHIVLTVTDLKRSADFYHKVLGMDYLESTDKTYCMTDGIAVLCLQLPPKQGYPNDRFDETRVGLDHVAFAVESRRQLEEALPVLRELGAKTVGIEFDPWGQAEYICFRDPDNIQVELYVMGSLPPSQQPK